MGCENGTSKRIKGKCYWTAIDVCNEQIKQYESLKSDINRKIAEANNLDIEFSDNQALTIDEWQKELQNVQNKQSNCPADTPPVMKWVCD